jgi:ferredoxin-thioredoxin reductase catalytic subunit
MMTTDVVRRRAESDAGSRGYFLNPNLEFLNDLLEGLRKNEERYGYPSCPCRLACGDLELDRDIVCPCDYRDPDCEEYGGCYCALYVVRDVYEGRRALGSVPERRPLEKQERAYGVARSEVSLERPVRSESTAPLVSLPVKKLWYCRQCGYVCFREDPPYLCPICKAKRELFAETGIRAK